MATDRELTDILEELSSYYEDGEENKSAGILSKAGFNIFESQQDLIEKLKHLHELDSDAETARKALHIGTFVMASPYVDEDTAEELFAGVKEEMDE